MSANPIFDGGLTVTIGGVNVTADVLGNSLSWGSTMPGGHGSASLRLAATAAGAWGPYHASVVTGSWVTIAHSGTTVYEGQIVNDVSHAVVEGGDAYYAIECAGMWWRAGLRDDFCAMWADDSYDSWFVSESANRNIQCDTEGALYLLAQKGVSITGGHRASIFYWVHDGIGSYDEDDPLLYFIAKLNYDVSASNWYADISTSPTNPWGTWTVQQAWNNATATSGMTILPLPSGTRAIRVSMYSNADVTALAANRWMKMTKICVASQRGGLYASSCTMTSANPTTITVSGGHYLKTGDRVAIKRESGSVGPHGWYRATYLSPTQFSVPVLGDSAVSVSVWYGQCLNDAMRHVAGDTADVSPCTSNLLNSYSVTSIGERRTDIVARPHSTRAAFLDELASRHSAPLDYGWWGALFFLAERSSPPAASDYLVDANLGGIDWSVFKRKEGAADFVKVLYTYSDPSGDDAPGGMYSGVQEGEVISAWYPSEPDFENAMLKVMVYDALASTAMTYAQAYNIGRQAYLWMRSDQYEGTVRIATPTVPKRAGGTKLAAYVRAGDYIENSRISTGPLQISSASYDAWSGVLTIGIGENRKEFVARLNKPLQGRSIYV